MISKLSASWKKDLLCISRDPMLSFFLAFLLLIPCILGLGLEFFQAYGSQIADLRPWFPYAGSILALFPGQMCGVVAAFLTLDDLDEGVFPALEISPVTLSGSWFFRSLLCCLVNLIFIILGQVLFIASQHFAIFLLSLPGFGVSIETYKTLLVSGPSYEKLFLQIPGMLLLGLACMALVAGFAKNKVEGLTFSKALGFIEMAPLSLLIPSNYKYLGSFLPSWWIVQGSTNLAAFPSPLNEISCLVCASGLAIVLWQAGQRFSVRRLSKGLL